MIRTLSLGSENRSALTCVLTCREIEDMVPCRDEKAEILARLTPEEKKKLTAVLLLEKLKKKRVRVDGKRVRPC